MTSAQQYRDTLALHYRKPLLNLPGTHDGCGAAFTVDHALDCCFGGLVTSRHNEVRETVGDLASLVWNLVRHEPIVKEAGNDEQGALVADLAIHGSWQPQCEGFLISGWWPQTLCHIALVLPRMSYEHQRWIRSASTPWLAKIEEQVVSQFVCQLMDYLGKRQTFSFIVCVNF